MSDRMWTYPELKFVTAHQYKLDSNKLTTQVNSKFHDGAEVRNKADIEKILRGKTIFNKEKRKR